MWDIAVVLRGPNVLIIPLPLSYYYFVPTKGTDKFRGSWESETMTVEGTLTLVVGLILEY